MRYSLDKILQVMVTTATSNPGYIMILHTYTSQPMSLPGTNFLHLTVSEMLPGQDFKGQGQYKKFKGQVKVTP